MFRAWDKGKNRLIYPSEAISGRYYYCPACKKVVTVRALGSYSVIPYFAHLKNVADIDCENYVPSEHTYTSYPAINRDIVSIQNDVPKNNIPKASFAKNLYLIFQNSWQLQLALTIRPTKNRWEGYVDIETTSGTKRIKNDKHDQVLQIDIKFDFSPNSISKSGNVDNEVWDHIVEEFDMINPIGGIFNAPFGTGKKLSIGEKFHIGETYVFIPKLDFEFNSTIKSISELVFSQNNTNLYQFTIHDSLKEEEIKEIENVFGIPVVENKPELRAIDFHPLRVTSDGTYIVSKETGKLIFTCQNNNAIEIVMVNGLADKNIKFIDDKVLIDITKSDGVEFYWNHYPLVRILKGYAEFFNPDGITVEIDKQEYNLLDKNISFQLDKSKSLKLLSNYLNLKNLIKYRLIKTLEIDNNFEMIINLKDEFELDANAFGYIYFSHNSYQEEKVNLTSNTINNRWLIFSGQYSKNSKEVNNTLSSLGQLNKNFNSHGKFHLMKLKNSNKIL